MNNVLRLANYDRDTFFDLLYGVLRIRNWGWNYTPASRGFNAVGLPQGARGGYTSYNPITETFEMATFDCDIRGVVQQLENFLEDAAAWHDDRQTDQSIWLEWITNTEEGRRSLLFGGKWDWQSMANSWPMLYNNNWLPRLAIMRHPLWESVSIDSVTETTLDTLGDIVTFTDVPGRVPARIYQTKFAGVAGSGLLETVWAGIRPDYEGSGSFVSVWECESTAVAGGMSWFWSGAEMTNVVSATSSNGYYAKCDFSTGGTTMTKRLSITLDDVVGANYDHFIGDYLVLARACVSAGEVAIQMGYGYYDTPVLPWGPVVNITDTTFQLYELGTVSIPPPGPWHDDVFTTTLAEQCKRFEIDIQAEQIDTGDLWIDCLVLVPAKHFLKMEQVWVQESTDKDAVAIVRENEDVFGVTRADDVAIRAAVTTAQNWYLPQGDSFIVVVAQRDGNCTIADEITLEMKYYPRWLSYEDS